jgi:23S rRNA (uracil1939-C5)-methyltransferase
MPTVVLSLTDMAHGGDAVGRHKDQVVFVPLGIPGERVRVEIRERRRNVWRGHLLEVIEPSPERVDAPCPYFGRCGGCQWQHLGYAAQLHWKREIVGTQLRRIGRQEEPVVLPMLGMADPWTYRNNVQLRPAPDGALGYYALRSHDVVAVERCPIAHPLLNDLLRTLGGAPAGVETVSLRAGTATGERMLILEGGEAPSIEVEDAPYSLVHLAPDGRTTTLARRPHFYERLLGRELRISAPSFFQVNTAQAERLVELVCRVVAVRPGETVLDLYCGVGTFALALAAQGARVSGIESAPWAIADAVANAERHGLAEPCTFYQGDVAEVLPRLGERCDAVVLDPPRAGCDARVLEALARCEPARIAYVSCDPATLARDILRLQGLGYALVDVQPVDMFPQTYHVETVCLMSRKSPEC